MKLVYTVLVSFAILSTAAIGMPGHSIHYKEAPDAKVIFK